MTLTGTQTIKFCDDVYDRYFIDTEFYEDGRTIDLISIGVVAADGREFYAVNRDAELHRVSQWVRDNVLAQLPPYGSPEWMPRTVIASRLERFVTPKDRYAEFWGYYADYDWVVLCQLFGTMMNLPNHFPKFGMDLKQYSRMLGDPKHPKQETGLHNALEDARWNKSLYEFLRKHSADRRALEAFRNWDRAEAEKEVQPWLVPSDDELRSELGFARFLLANAEQALPSGGCIEEVRAYLSGRPGPFGIGPFAAAARGEKP